MAQLSRVNKYKDLRTRLEEETTESSSKTKKEFSRSRRTSDSSFTHANQPVRAHQQSKVTSMNNTIPSSPLMDNLIDEVKQYNLDNGNIVSDDTQINILKQLDGTQLLQRNNHFMPMEEDEEQLGTTMKLPVSEIEQTLPQEIQSIDQEEKEYYEEKAIDNGPDILPISSPAESVDFFEPEQESVEPVIEAENQQEDTVEIQPTQEPEEVQEQEEIVLTQDDFNHAQDFELEQDNSLEDYFGMDQEEEVEEEKVIKPKKIKKAKKEKKNKLPSEKKIEEVSQPKEKSNQDRLGMILNIVLAVMILLLIAAIALTVYYIQKLG